MTTPNAAPEDPLEMAANLLVAVRAIAEALDRGLSPAAEHQLGIHGEESAKLAAHLATVSIARDLRRIADHLTGGAP